MTPRRQRMIFVGIVLTGMAGRALFPDLLDQETILPTLATTLFNPWVAGVIMVVILAAIMSTVDSLLILASSAVVRDVMQKIMNSSKTDVELTKYAKYLTLIIGIGGVFFALQETPLIFWFVLFAWNGLGAAFAPVILCALWYPPTNCSCRWWRSARDLKRRGSGIGSSSRS